MFKTQFMNELKTNLLLFILNWINFIIMILIDRVLCMVVGMLKKKL